VEGMT